MKAMLFKLSMPNIGSWNGKWTGEGNLYCRTRTYKNDEEKLKKVLLENYHHYNFGDGWSAGVTISEITSDEKRKYNKATKGFYGYEWMIDEIEQYGRIRTVQERYPKEQLNESD